MPRVRRQKASGRAIRTCGVCLKVITKGEEYYTWSFRSGRQVRCLDHPPQRSDLTGSKMSAVYAAIEDAEAQLETEIESVTDIKSAIELVAQVAREVVDEYREAAEHFGGQGENAERADELEGWVDELESFDPDESYEPETLDEDEQREQAIERAADDGDVTFNDAMQAIQDEWDEEHDDDNTEAIENAKTEATDLLGQCPL